MPVAPGAGGLLVRINAHVEAYIILKEADKMITEEDLMRCQKPDRRFPQCRSLYALRLHGTLNPVNIC